MAYTTKQLIACSAGKNADRGVGGLVLRYNVRFLVLVGLLLGGCSQQTVYHTVHWCDAFFHDTTVIAVGWEYDSYVPNHDWADAGHGKVQQFLEIRDVDGNNFLRRIPLQQGLDEALYAKGSLLVYPQLFYLTSGGGESIHVWCYNFSSGENRYIQNGFMVITSSTDGSRICIADRSDSPNKIIDVLSGETKPVGSNTISFLSRFFWRCGLYEGVSSRLADC